MFGTKFKLCHVKQVCGYRHQRVPLKRNAKVRCAIATTEAVHPQKDDDNSAESSKKVLRMSALVLSHVGIGTQQVQSILESAVAPLQWEADQKEDNKPLLNLRQWEDEFSDPHKKILGYLWESDPEAWKADIEQKTELLSKLGLSSKEMTDLFLLCPQLLRFSSEDIQQPIEYIKELGVDETAISKVILAEPQLLCFQVKEHLAPGIQYMEDMGVPRSSVSTLAVLNPTMLAAAVEEKRLLDRASGFLEAANEGLDKQAKMMARDKALQARKEMEAAKRRGARGGGMYGL